MAILSTNALDFTSNSVSQTERLGLRLGELIQNGDIICLQGDLGAGKTAIARGIGRGWGTAMRVTSPTFTLINEYPRLSDKLILFHLDFYRLEGVGEIITTGIEDVLDRPGALMIEWPERVEDFIPADRFIIYMRHATEFKRNLRFEATGKRSQQLLAEFKQRAFGI
ncbi:MAG: tRNA (adenosine(37)-N6)-threonylcarbamoyltransferase complex ATPase subunit type 1 TsaE [Candidatus Promineifilaceae bacterium]